MEFFDRFKKKKQETDTVVDNNISIIIEDTASAVEQLFKIELNEQGVFIDEKEIAFPIRLTELEIIFGVPTQLYYERNVWNVIWDDHGIYTNGNLDDLDMLYFLLKPESRLNHLPTGLFKGNVIVNGVPLADMNEEVVKVNKYQFHKARYRGEELSEVYSYILMNNFDYQEEIDEDKYKLTTGSKNAIQFQDFNFKLLVIEELMYNKELLQPKFDVYEFAQLYKQREIKIDNEGYDPIPEVIQYFESLEIDKILAEEVTELYQDGGNNIYGNMIPFWSGEDGYFDIRTYEDIKHFSNLKKITVFGAATEEIQAFKAKGIDVEML